MNTAGLRPAAPWMVIGVAIAVATGIVLGNRSDGRFRRSSATHPFAAAPITDLGTSLYLGRFQGGLYPHGSNTIPPDHLAAGLERARSIQPLDGQGKASPNGKYVLLSIGMSNATQEFCCPVGNAPTSWSFMGQAAADPSVNHTSLVIFNGAEATKTAPYWTSPKSPEYERVAMELRASGLSEAQVEVVWLKDVISFPKTSLPDPDADAYGLELDLGNIVRALRVRYPNLKLVFLSSRTYGGYATSGQDPEPFAYETGFSVKWLVQAQIQQMHQNGSIVDERAGNLNYDTVAPWIGWGPYLWSDGPHPRSDGVTWERRDFGPDGLHPSPYGERKVGTMLLDFFKRSPLTRGWFAASPPQSSGGRSPAS